MRWATPVVIVLVTVLAACNDLREFRGTWQGNRIGDAPVLHIGPGDVATLDIDEIDAHGIQARLAVPGLFTETRLASLPGAEADALANLTFAGGPVRVYLSFMAIADGGGDAVVFIALYDDDRIEVRVLRSGSLPLYAIFALKAA